MSESGIFSLRKFTWSLAWTLLILVLSLLPKSTLPKVDMPFPYLDKLVHFTMYFILMLLIAWECKKTGMNMLVWKGFAIAVLLSIGTELGQKYLMAGRNFEVLDILSNIVGSLSGVILYQWISGVRNENN